VQLNLNTVNDVRFGWRNDVFHYTCEHGVIHSIEKSDVQMLELFLMSLFANDIAFQEAKEKAVSEVSKRIDELKNIPKEKYVRCRFNLLKDSEDKISKKAYVKELRARYEKEFYFDEKDYKIFELDSTFIFEFRENCFTIRHPLTDMKVKLNYDHRDPFEVFLDIIDY